MKIPVVRNVLEHNERAAEAVRHYLSDQHIRLINVMGSPGAGKTTFIAAVIQELTDRGIRCGVIEGDIETTKDAELLANRGVPVVQINTSAFGGQCHLEADWILSGLKELPSSDLDVVFVENVGNLVCPAEFDVGAHLSLAILSVPEGADKPLKYPLMFRTVHAVVISKQDVMAAFDYDREELLANLRQVAGIKPVYFVSARTGEGVEPLVSFLREHL